MPRKSRLTYKDLIDIKNRFDVGEHLQDIAKDYNYTQANFSNALKSKGVCFKKTMILPKYE